MIIWLVVLVCVWVKVLGETMPLIDKFSNVARAMEMLGKLWQSSKGGSEKTSKNMEFNMI